MKDATGEVSMTVVTIIVIALVLGVATLIFSPGSDGKSTAQKWIENIFEAKTGVNAN